MCMCVSIAFVALSRVFLRPSVAPPPTGRMSGNMKLTFLAICIMALAAGATANTITGTKFPFEGCKQSSSTGLYGAYLDSYNLTDGGSIMCFRITVKDRAACRRTAKFPNNKTHCCDVGLNKFKFFPNQLCRQAVKGATIKRADQVRPTGAAVTYQTMTGIYNGTFVMKLTNLRLTPETAKGALICIELQDPCPTMSTWSNDPYVLEFNLYDVKSTNVKTREAYECCPAGVTDVAEYPFA